MHLALLALVWQEKSAQAGVPHGKPGALTQSAVTVQLVKAEVEPKLSLAPPPEPEPQSAVTPDATTQEPISSPLPAPTEVADITAPPPSPPKPDLGSYFPMGHLTRLPAPTVPINLNDPAFDGPAFDGSIELNIFIDAGGLVTEVAGSAASDEARAFADYVAARLRNTRFVPGEFRGVAVNSRMQITVVSKALPAQEERK